MPASLISNRANEIGRFSPEIKFLIAHPGANTGKNALSKDKNRLNEFDLVITTYALAQRYGRIKSHVWNYIILDEAQAIKNPGTKQAKAVKSLTFRNRIIMTDTPIENRLSDIWSLFDSLQELLAGKFP
ncbi:MAG: hypothetical protein J7L16_10585 [Deltaproteobacteria bacterium]|nr:hypothetical protein [Deltaproteobacteria bacterium]